MTESSHPIHTFFAEAVYEAFTLELGVHDAEVHQYVTELLVKFIHQDGVYAIQDADGRRVYSVQQMLAEGDVMQNADSFAREREVHRHIGDFLLFWSGLYPECLKQLKVPTSLEALVNPARQGKESYHIVSTFDFPPHTAEAPMFRLMSEAYEDLQFALGVVRRKFDPGFQNPWRTGFSA